MTNNFKVGAVIRNKHDHNQRFKVKSGADAIGYDVEDLIDKVYPHTLITHIGPTNPSEIYELDPEYQPYKTYNHLKGLYDKREI